MTTEQLLAIDFKSRVYCSDNDEYIRHNMEANESDDYAEEALDHYQTSAEAFGKETLNEEEAARFKWAAARYNEQGFVGILN